MAAYDYEGLKKKYEDFAYPVIHVQIGGKIFRKTKPDFGSPMWKWR